MTGQQPTPDEIRASLSIILQSRQFADSAKLSGFLSYIVEKTLNGDARSLKEYVIGTEVFGRRADYDPRIDPVVRSAAGRLRKKLAEFYLENQSETIVIDLPKGHYVPTFHHQAPEFCGAAQIQSSTPIQQNISIRSLLPLPVEATPLSSTTIEQAAVTFSIETPPSDLAAPFEQNSKELPRLRRSHVAMLTLAAVILGSSAGWFILWRFNNLGVNQAALPPLASENSSEIMSGQTATRPVIDGRLDTVWNDRAQNEIRKRLQGDEKIIARFGTLWDGANLYLMVEARTDGTNPRNRESGKLSDKKSGDDLIEVYLDTSHDRRRGYQSDDFQFIFPVQGAAQGAAPREQNDRIAGVEYASTQESWGWRVEAAIPWATLGMTAGAGRAIGFDVGLRNGASNYLMWSGTANNAFDTSGFGELRLSSKLVNAALSNVLPVEDLSLPPAKDGLLRVSNGKGDGQTDDQEAGWALIRFSLPKLPSRVLNARLRLYCDSASDNGQGRIIKVYGAIPAGAKLGARLRDQNLSWKKYSSEALFQSAILVSSAPDWFEWDVTPIVSKAARDGKVTVDLAIRSQTFNVTLNRAESWAMFKNSAAAGHEPRLMLEY